MREAIAISSPSLSRVLDEISAGGFVPDKKVRTAYRAALRYELRIAGRATPFGVFAGVATAVFRPQPSVSWGDAHAKSVDVDMEWLGGVVTRLEADATVLRRLRFVANDLCTRRGERLVVPFSPAGGTETGARARKGRTLEVSLRLTRPVARVVAAAEHPVLHADLVRDLLNGFPGTSTARAEELLRRLIEVGALVSELRSAPSPRPLEALLQRLEGGAHYLSPQAGHIVTEMRAVQDELDQYAKTPVGSFQLLAQVTDRMRAVQPAETPVTLDLGLDLRVALPEILRTEVEGAVATLWSVTAGSPAAGALAGYHRDFLERYGIGRAVPLRELLDPHAGLDAPAGYLFPRSTRNGTSGGRPAVSSDSESRERLLAALAQEAAASGEREVVVSDELLAQLSGDRPAPPSVDVIAELGADSLEAVTAGEFRLVILGTHPQGGAYGGRFGELLDDAAVAVPRFLHAAGRTPGVAAQVAFPPVQPRSGNVMRVPSWTDTSVTIGAFADRSRPGTLGLDDLVVTADEHRFAVLDARTGQEVTPLLPHVLGVASQAPNPVRFLAEAAVHGTAGRLDWDWGAATALPFLPRIRRGRSVLAPARWRPDPRLVQPCTDFDAWRRQFDTWRRRWRVPGIVQVANFDHRMTLHLDDPAHLSLLRTEWQRHPQAPLIEPDTGGRSDGRWLAADGASHHASELVFTLRAGRASRPAVRSSLRSGPRITYPPGSQWLYAKLYCHPAVHDDILVDHLPALLAGSAQVPDRWFYLRYDDGEPHLRLRFHGDSGHQLSAELLPRLSAWAAALADAGLCGRMTLDTYDPEYERYGPGAMAAAEAVFQADGDLCVNQLSMLRKRQLPAGIDAELLAVANVVDLARRMLGDTDAERWLDGLPRTIGGRRTGLRTLSGIIEPADDRRLLRGMPGGASLIEGWEQRAAAVATFRDRLSAPGGPDPETVLASLVHMHHNRLIGIDVAGERRVLSLARNASRSLRLARTGST